MTPLARFPIHIERGLQKVNRETAALCLHFWLHFNPLDSSCGFTSCNNGVQTTE